MAMYPRFGSMALAICLFAGCARAPGSGSAAQAAAKAADAPRATTDAVAVQARPAFAALPDRGELLAYPSQDVLHDGAYTWHRANVSEAHALHAMADGHLRLTAPSGAQLVFQYDRHVEHPSGDWTWVGHLPGHPEKQTILTFGEHAAFGSIAQTEGPPLRLTIRNGVSWLIETDPRKVAMINNAATKPTRPDFKLPPRHQADGVAAAGERAIAMSSAPTTAGAAATATTTVDLVIGYTAAFASDNGGASGALTRLNYLVDVTNAAYRNSAIAAQVRLLKVMQVAYTDTNSNDTALEAVSGSTGSGSTTPDPAFNALRAAREQYGADLVSFVRKFDEQTNGGCGIAWLIGGGQSPITTGDSSFGYSVVSDGEDFGSDGKKYFCLDETLAHELGHNMGAAHDVETAKGDDGVLNADDYGAFPYSFGYKTTSANGNFYTVMAYGDTGQQIFRIFSDPRSTFCGGLACGNASTADNARTLTQTIPTIAGFRATVIGNGGKARIDINGDGHDDIFWSNQARGASDWWLMSGTQWTYGGGKAVASKFHVAGRGDFDGDGRGDVLWTDGVTLYIWHSEASGGFSIQTLANYPSGGWLIAGVGDLNGDGRDDIFWSNPSKNTSDWWLMAGTHWTYGGGKSVQGIYRVAGVGDFDGDGRADVLWTDGSKLYIWHSQSTGGFAIQFLANYPVGGWAVGGIGDANADGRDDIFWSNRTKASAEVWMMNGTSWTYGGGRSVGSQYHVVGLGDFDGDGRADVLWADSSKLWIWHSVGNGSFQSLFLADLPSGWSPIL
jgi:hypothetical protein